MNNDSFKCICGKTFEMKKFKKHFKNCQYFLKKFEKFDYKMQLLLKSIIAKDIIHLIRFLLKRYIHLIDKIILKNNENSENNSEIIENEKKNIEKEIKPPNYNNNNNYNIIKNDNNNLLKSLSVEISKNNFDFNQKEDFKIKNKKNNKNIDLNLKNNFENNFNKNINNDNDNDNIILDNKNLEDVNEINDNEIFNIFAKNNISNNFNIFQSENAFLNNNNNIYKLYEKNGDKSDLYKSEINQNNKTKKGRYIKKNVFDRKANYDYFDKRIPKLNENESKF